MRAIGLLGQPCLDLALDRRPCRLANGTDQGGWPPFRGPGGSSSTASGWMQAAGAYWAGRVNERQGVTNAAEKWFNNASRYPTTFYGMLAMRKLGLDIAQEISAASLTAEQLDILAETPAGYRAIALLEIGRRDLAAQELERIDPAGDPKLEEAVIVTADAARLGDLSSNLAQRIARPADDASAQFPIPSWQPRGGFKIDPALVYAVARQESKFDPKAVSPAGATGLMQIMPETADQIAPNRQASLFDPSTNLDLGQRYLRTLMRDPNIGENLLLLAVAYNRGWVTRRDCARCWTMTIHCWRSRVSRPRKRAALSNMCSRIIGSIAHGWARTRPR